MYVPPAFAMADLADLHAAIRAARLAHLVTTGPAGLLSTPLPLLLDPAEGEFGTLYGHFARANPQATEPVTGEALAIFAGPDAYVTPAFYPTKAETGRVVPTWNYVAVHAYGALEFFDDATRLHDIVTRLTDLHEAERAEPWRVTDAPAPFVDGLLKAIVGFRLPIARLEGKRKLSQNRPTGDRAGVAEGLAAGTHPDDPVVAKMIPK